MRSRQIALLICAALLSSCGSHGAPPLQSRLSSAPLSIRAATATPSRLYVTGPCRLHSYNLDGTAAGPPVHYNCNMFGGAYDKNGVLFAVADGAIVAFNSDGSRHPLRSPAIKNPYALAISPSGIAYIISRRDPTVYSFDTATGGAFHTFTTRLYTPTGVAVDRNGHIYVSDETANLVGIFDSDGHLLRRITSGVLDPEGVAVDRASGKIYVANGGVYGNGIVTTYLPDGGRVAPTLSAPGALHIAVGNGKIYVTRLVSTYVREVDAYDSTGHATVVYGSADIYSAVPTPDGDVLVFTFFHGVLKFDGTTDAVSTFVPWEQSSAVTTTSNGVAVLIWASSLLANFNRIEFYDAAGNFQSRIPIAGGTARDIAVDASGNAWVVVQPNNQYGSHTLLLAYAQNGTLVHGPIDTGGTDDKIAIDQSTIYLGGPDISRCHTSGTCDGVLVPSANTGFVSGIAVDGSGNIQVSRYGYDHNVYKYSPAGALLSTKALSFPQFSQIGPLRIDSHGNVYLNSANGIVSFTPSWTPGPLSFTPQSTIDDFAVNN